MSFLRSPKRPRSPSPVKSNVKDRDLGRDKEKESRDRDKEKKFKKHKVSTICIYLHNTVCPWKQLFFFT